MKLFKISQTANSDYDTWDAAVVAAESQDDAQRMRPDGELSHRLRWGADGKLQWCDDLGLWRGTDCHGMWVRDLKLVTVEYLGEAKEGTEKGVILASFNAG